MAAFVVRYGHYKTFFYSVKHYFIYPTKLVGHDSHCTSSCTSSAKGHKSAEIPRKYWVFCLMHVRQSSNITSHKLLYTVLYIRTCICTGDAKNYCTKGVVRFKIRFSMTCMTCILLWQQIRPEGPLQFARVISGVNCQTMTPLSWPPPAPVTCPRVFIICYRYINFYIRTA